MLIVTTIQELITENRTEDAINVGLEYSKKHRKDLYKELIILSAQYKNWKTQRVSGKINSDEILNRINLSTLSIADQFEKKSISAVREKGVIVNLEKEKRYGFIQVTSNRHEDNIFFHFTNIDNKIIPEIGKKVTFGLNVYRHNLVAVNVFISNKKTRIHKKKPNRNSYKKPNQSHKIKSTHSTKSKSNKQKQQAKKKPKPMTSYNIKDWLNYGKNSINDIHKLIEKELNKLD